MIPLSHGLGINPVNSVDFVAAFGPLNDTHATLSTDSLQQINYASASLRQLVVRSSTQLDTSTRGDAADGSALPHLQ